MSSRCLTLVRDGLLSIGYRSDRLRGDVPVPSNPSARIGLVAYSDQPFDARTSAVAAVDGETFDEEALALLKPVGSPVIVRCQEDHATFWKQSAGEVSFIERVPAGKITSFFRKNREELAPGALYRAKVWGRMEEATQLHFVDVGLLPVVEQEAGESLRRLLEHSVTATKSALGWKKEISDADGKWLLKSIFWLLAAKILQDKGVPGFVRMNLCELEGVYDKLARHYDHKTPRPVQINGARRRDALLEAAKIIQTFGHCGAVTTESLSWVYESTLIDRATRQKLGTHSTPTWLVDDIVARLRPWIEAMPVDDRKVCEPACGHAGFLISAMRLLSELLPEERAEERKSYLRKRLHGIEIDPFAYEVARLSLTLADVPNDNGWMLENTDMFKGGVLRSAISKASIVLANPPFEKFGDARPQGAMFNRADETFRQIVEALPQHGVFGIVMPQTILHSTQGKALRRKLLDEYDISEITLFADKVFNYGEPETAVILGRRVGTEKKHGSVIYRRVREEQIETYAKSLAPSSLARMPTTQFEAQGGSLLVPELSEVWEKLQNRPKLGQLIEGGQGFQHKGAKDNTLPKEAVRESNVEIEGLAKGFAGWNEHQLTHELPEFTWLNLSNEVIRARGVKKHGMISGRKQLLLNYAPVSRGPWRLKGLVDRSGHPVTSRFMVFRSKEPTLSVSVMWAICNSPIANAYIYSHSSKRDVLAGTLIQMPVFTINATAQEPLEFTVDAYFKAAKGTKALAKRAKPQSKSSDSQMPLGFPDDDNNSITPDEELKYLHWRIDAEVLRLYNLPAADERRILELFTGEQRRGVPFVQNEYFPKGFNHLDRLSDLLAITADWTQTNRRRCQLIRKDVKGQLTDKETAELERLEYLADARIALMDLQHPTEPDEIQRAVERLKREGKWIE
jgi:N-6 DNA Methylase